MTAASRSYTSTVFIEWEDRIHAREIWPRGGGYGEIRADVSEELAASIVRVGDMFLKRRYVSTKLHGILCQETINSQLHTDANLEVTLNFCSYVSV
jgi:hypothetical protein